jgi:polysaccharide deacetylase 2 family uncharacterized protein YibQ
MRRRFDDEDEKRPGWFWRFIRGVVFALVVSVVAVVVLSVYVLPPPPEPEPEPVSTGPEIVGGIEVSDAPAYSGAAAGSEEASASEAETLAPVELSGPALAVNSQAFEAPSATPLIAVILDDTAANPLLHELLFSLDIPLTVGVVAGGGGDQVTAEAAYAAGFEVVAQLPLSQRGASGGGGLEYGLPPEEAASRTETLIQRLPMAVGASRPLAAVTPPNAGVLQGMLGALRPLGFAYVDHGVAPGANSGAMAAAGAVGAEDGLGAIVGVSRYTIPAGASAAEAIAVLDAAATAEGGGAVVVAAPGEEVLLALQLWGGEGSSGAALLAPLSAVIRRQNGG